MTAARRLQCTPIAHRARLLTRALHLEIGRFGRSVGCYRRCRGFQDRSGNPHGSDMTRVCVEHNVLSRTDSDVSVDQMSDPDK
jgi:hypothetical protein